MSPTSPGPFLHRQLESTDVFSSRWVGGILSVIDAVKNMSVRGGGICRADCNLMGAMLRRVSFCIDLSGSPRLPVLPAPVPPEIWFPFSCVVQVLRLICTYLGGSSGIRCWTSYTTLLGSLWCHVPTGRSALDLISQQ